MTEKDKLAKRREELHHDTIIQRMVNSPALKRKIKKKLFELIDENSVKSATMAVAKANSTVNSRMLQTVLANRLDIAMKQLNEHIEAIKKEVLETKKSADCPKNGETNDPLEVCKAYMETRIHENDTETYKDIVTQRERIDNLQEQIDPIRRMVYALQDDFEEFKKQTA